MTGSVEFRISNISMGVPMTFRRLLPALVLLLLCRFAQAQTEVTVYTYNDRVPFVIDKTRQEGLEYRLCEWLSRASGTYHFTLKVVPAEVAKGKVAKNELDGVLIGVSKAWFPPEIRTGWLWTPPLLWDKNLVISLGSRKVEYQGPDSLAGHKLLGVKGFFYPGLMEPIKDGRIARVDSDSEISSLRMLAAHEGDVTIVSEWTMLYAQLRMDLPGDFYQANQSFQEFERCILVPPTLKALHEHLGKLLADVRKNNGWQKATEL